MEQFGVYSEVGKLRKVIVHRPGLEMRRLTPTNCVELLFDDVIWARKARQEHDAFVDLMRTEFGVDVIRVHELLAGRGGRPGGPGLYPRSQTGAQRSRRGRRRRAAGLDGRDGPGHADRPPDRRRDRDGAAGGFSQVSSRRPMPPRISCCRRCPINCSPATAPAGSMAASR